MDRQRPDCGRGNIGTACKGRRGSQGHWPPPFPLIFLYSTSPCFEFSPYPYASSRSKRTMKSIYHSHLHRRRNEEADWPGSSSIIYVREKEEHRWVERNSFPPPKLPSEQRETHTPSKPGKYSRARIGAMERGEQSKDWIIRDPGRGFLSLRGITSIGCSVENLVRTSCV